MSTLNHLALQTPAFVYDESRIIKIASVLERLRQLTGCRVLYSVKAFPFLPVLRLLAPRIDGFSVSSLFEAKLARIAGGGSLHITTPGLRSEEIEEIGDLCGFVAFNSLEQFQRYAPLLEHRASVGLRVNPKLSFLQDPRFDPCRAFSKLGVPFDRLDDALAQDATLAGRLCGLHVHNAFASRSFVPLAQTIERLEETLMHRLPKLEWVNLGGGYLFESLDDLDPLCRIVEKLRSRWGVEVIFEPGKAVVGAAGYLAARVIDLFESDGKPVAILDSSVNHHPEIFEYQSRPQPGWNEPADGYAAILAGCTSLIKANRFNGHNLPSIYAWDGHLEVRRLKQYAFDDYFGQWAADSGADSASWHERTPSMVAC
ncbi:MAG: carboxynorspermidine decarboxylase [Proteobacteria bacterium]|nr:carboxynorspermidine decarboxylase [Pseudomonadota bacterium]